MSKKKKTPNVAPAAPGTSPAETAVAEPAPEVTPRQPLRAKKEPVFSSLTGLVIVLVTLLADVAIVRVILHKWEPVVNLQFLRWETVFTVIVSVGMVVAFNHIRITDGCEKAESMEEFPQGAPVGFLAGHSLALWLELAIVLGLLFTGLNSLVFTLLGYESWKPTLFFFYQIGYGILLVLLAHWLTCGRMLQRDWLQEHMKKKTPAKVQKFQKPENSHLQKKK